MLEKFPDGHGELICMYLIEKMMKEGGPSVDLVDNILLYGTKLFFKSETKNIVFQFIIKEMETELRLLKDKLNSYLHPNTTLTADQIKDILKINIETNEKMRKLVQLEYKVIENLKFNTVVKEEDGTKYIDLNWAIELI